MSNNPRFEDALDSCIADIIAGRRTVADCLAAWPQFRDELAPLLEAATAMDAEPPVAERAPDPVRRAEFMAMIRTTPQQSPRPRLLSTLGRIFTMPRLALPAPVQRASLVASAAVVLAIAALAATLVLGTGTTTAYASTVTVFAGTVEQEIDGRWVALPDGARLNEGARLRTGDDGSAVLTFIDGSTVGIEANTELLIEFVVFGVVRQISLQQFSGSLWNDVVTDVRPGSFYTVRTPDAVVSARGTLFETNVNDEGTTVDTFDGLVEVQAGDETTFVTPGEFASARAHQQVIPAQAREDSSRLALSVSAPFAASLVAPDGKATGVRPDGVAFNQISGAATSHPSDGDQQLELSKLTPGIYRLLLSRTGEGGGEIVLQFGDERVTLSVAASDNAVGVDLRVSIDADGKLRVEPINQRSIEAREVEDGTRLVVTEAAERRATPAARRDRADGEDRDNRDAGRDSDADADADDSDATDDSDDGDSNRGRGKSLQDQARDRLQDQLADEDEDGGLGRQLDDKTLQKLQERLDRLDEREAERQQERERRDAEREGRSEDDDSDGDDDDDGDSSGRDDGNRGRGAGASDRDASNNDASDGDDRDGDDRDGDDRDGDDRDSGRSRDDDDGDRDGDDRDSDTRGNDSRRTPDPRPDRSSDNSSDDDDDEDSRGNSGSGRGPPDRDDRDGDDEADNDPGSDRGIRAAGSPPDDDDEDDGPGGGPPDKDDKDKQDKGKKPD